MWQTFIYKKRESAKNKTQDSDCLWENNRKRERDTAWKYKASGNVLVHNLGDGFTSIHFNFTWYNTYIYTYICIQILLYTSNIS